MRYGTKKTLGGNLLYAWSRDLKLTKRERNAKEEIHNASPKARFQVICWKERRVDSCRQFLMLVGMWN